MFFTVEQLAELTEAVETPGRKVSDGSEKRRANRRQLPLRAELLQNGVGVPVRLTDISSRGLGLYHTVRMKRNEQFVLRLRGEKRSVRILCTVVHTHAINPTTYKMGAEFTCLLPDTEAAPAAMDAAADAAEQKRISDSIFS